MRAISISSFLGLWSTYARNLSRHKLVSSMLASQTSHLFAVTVNFQDMLISLPVPLFYLAGVGHGERCCHQMEHCTATDLLQPQPRQGDTHALVHGSPTCSAVTSCNIHARSTLHGAHPNAVQKTDAAVCTRDALDLRTVPFRGGTERSCRITHAQTGHVRVAAEIPATTTCILACATRDAAKSACPCALDEGEL